MAAILLLVPTGGVVSYGLLGSRWLETRVNEDTLHLLHLIWGMSLAFVASALLGWLYLRRSMQPFSETLASEKGLPDRTQELRRYALWFVQLRWLAIVLTAILSLLATQVMSLLEESLLLPLGILVAFLLLTNLLFLRASRRSSNPYRVIIVQTLCDLAVLTLLLHFSGGIENSFYAIYVFHVVIAAILLSSRHSYLITTVASVLLAAVALGEYGHMIPHYEIRLTPHEHAERVDLHGHRSPHPAGFPAEQDPAPGRTHHEADPAGGHSAENSAQHEAHLSEPAAKHDSGGPTASRTSQPIGRSNGDEIAARSPPGEPRTGSASKEDEPAGSFVKSGQQLLTIHPTHDLTFVLGRLLPFLGILYCLTYLTQIVVAQLRRREEQLLNALRERRLMEAQLIQAGKMAAIGELAGNFAHEVNNPVAVISGKAKLLLDEYEEDGLPPDVAKDLRKIVLQAGRISKITSGLLAFSRPSLGKKSRLDLNQIVQSTLDLVEDALRQANIRHRCDLAHDLPQVLGNQNELQQVFFNILTNAIDATEHGGVLTISTRARRSQTEAREVGEVADVAEVSVADNGAGMAPETLQRIFEPFFTTKREGKGTGLGLSITQGLVHSHQGRIDVRSRPGEGTTFVVTIPAAESASSTTETSDAGIQGTDPR